MLWRAKATAADRPFRDELLSVERLQERALALAASFTIDANPRRRRARNIFPRFHDNARVLHGAYRTLAGDVRTGQGITAAAEWLLDNFHLITSEIGDVRRQLPGTYYRELPTLASREQAGHTRIYAMAVELVRHSDSLIDRQQLAVFVNSYQRVAPLTIGELWAWPSMLKLALIENLRRLASDTLEARRARLAADAYVSRIEHQTENARRQEVLALASTFGIASVVQLLHQIREYAFSCRRSEQPLRTTSRRAKQPRKTRFAVNTSDRRLTRYPWRMPSPACVSAPRSTGASMSSRSAWSSRCCSAIPRAHMPGWIFSAAIGSARPSRSSRRQAVRRKYAWLCGPSKARGRRPPTAHARTGPPTSDSISSTMDGVSSRSTWRTGRGSRTGSSAWRSRMRRCFTSDRLRPSRRCCSRPVPPTPVKRMRARSPCRSS